MSIASDLHLTVCQARWFSTVTRMPLMRTFPFKWHCVLFSSCTVFLKGATCRCVSKIKEYLPDSDWTSVFFYLPQPELAGLYNKQSQSTPLRKVWLFHPCSASVPSLSPEVSFSHNHMNLFASLHYFIQILVGCYHGLFGQNKIIFYACEYFIRLSTCDLKKFVMEKKSMQFL